MHIGEVAAATAGDGDLLANSVLMFDQDSASAAPAGFDGAHHSRSAGSDDKDVEINHAL